MQLWNIITISTENPLGRCEQKGSSSEKFI